MFKFNNEFRITYVTYVDRKRHTVVRKGVSIVSVLKNFENEIMLKKGAQFRICKIGEILHESK